jgi:hypothetical protein
LSHQPYATATTSTRTSLGSCLINLIASASTRTRSGLQVHAELDAAPYPKGLKVTDAELAAIDLSRAAFQGEWNYTIHPRPPDP